jgi:hypothetical protein
MTEDMNRKLFECVPGTEVVNGDGDTIGKIASVIPDPRTLEPKWLIVDPGLFRASHYVPAVDASVCADDGGEYHGVPYTRHTVTHAQRVGKDRYLTRDDEAELAEYYRIAS